jgi:acyl dehydratase
MPLDPDLLLNFPPIETHYRVTPATAILYALGVGAHELPFVFEEQLRVLPTFATVAAYPGFIWRTPRFNVAWERVLHAETSIELHDALPTEGNLIGSTRFGPIYDKGADKGAICYQTREIRTPGGALVATVRNASFLRGDGGFGGSGEGQPRPHAIPNRAPDETHVLPTASNQALIYRLSGDLNPIHLDPAVAASAGFDRPILHGLCTYGVVGRSLLALLCGNEPTALRRMDARFSAPCYPGETIRTEIWRESAGHASFRATAVERDALVLNNGYVEFA